MSDKKRPCKLFDELPTYMAFVMTILLLLEWIVRWRMT